MDKRRAEDRLCFVRWFPLQSLRARTWLVSCRRRPETLLSWSCLPSQGRYREMVGRYGFRPAPLTFSKWPTGPSLLRRVPSGSPRRHSALPGFSSPTECAPNRSRPVKGLLSWGFVPYGTIPSSEPVYDRGCLPDPCHFQGLVTLLAACFPLDLPPVFHGGAPLGFSLQSLSLSGSGNSSRSSLPSWRFRSSLPFLLRMRWQRG